jgi:hypothetical protein
MLDCHVNAFLIRPGRVLGLRLQHLTLRHYWILEALGSPFVSGGVAQLSDLGIAAWVCAQRPNAAMRCLRHPARLSARLARLGQRCRTLEDVQTAREGFEAYWRAYTAFPDPWQKEGQKIRETCLPQSMGIAWALMERMPEARVWGMPMTEALTYYAAACERGGTDFVTERQKSAGKLNSEASHG